MSPAAIRINSQQQSHLKSIQVISGQFVERSWMHFNIDIGNKLNYLSLSHTYLKQTGSIEGNDSWFYDHPYVNDKKALPSQNVKDDMYCKVR